MGIGYIYVFLGTTCTRYVYVHDIAYIHMQFM